VPNQTLPNKVITELPPVVAEHIDAVNAFDTDRIVNTFAVDAYINDNHREIWGADAIRKFIDNEILGDHVTMQVRQIIDNYGDIIVRARWDGTYDKTNLPDELIVTSYFSIRDDKIVSLAIIAEPAFPLLINSPRPKNPGRTRRLVVLSPRLESQPIWTDHRRSA
jgi:hypothetical protein